jgi:hypothetical protein
MAALPILNSVLWGMSQYDRLIIVNLLVILTIWVLDRAWGFYRDQFQMNVKYEKIDLIKKEKREEMLKDLSERTGLVVLDFEIQKINFLRDVAEIKITYSYPK